MYLFFTIIVLVISILLVGVVLIQNSKGGGLTSSLSSSNQLLGAAKTTDALEKITWGLAGALLVSCIIITMFIEKPAEAGQSELSGQIQTELPAPGFEIETPAATASPDSAN